MPRLWYLDSSVALRIFLAHSPSAVVWFDTRIEAGDTFVSSRLLELETVRVLRRESIDTALAEEFVAELALLSVDDRLITEAAAIRPHVKSLDALHLASAQRLGAGAVTVVTHDANLAQVAEYLGFDVYDPVE
ncbi:MAG: type II toxin-antitoxin system VapC family toxin [Microbacterium sp.]